MSPGQTGHITRQMGRVPGTDGTHTRGCPAKILSVYWFKKHPPLRERVVTPAGTESRAVLRPVLPFLVFVLGKYPDNPYPLN